MISSENVNCNINHNDQNFTVSVRYLRALKLIICFYKILLVKNSTNHIQHSLRHVLLLIQNILENVHLYFYHKNLFVDSLIWQTVFMIFIRNIKPICIAYTPLGIKKIEIQ